MSDMHGKICMVTGATDGIGKVTARELAKLGATMIVIGRNRAKGERVISEIKAVSGNPNVDLMVADLSSQAQLRQMAADFRRKYSRLHVLVNNVGAVFTGYRRTVDGIEMTWALNHLSYFLLTNLLLDVLQASAPARVVNVSSVAHEGGKIAFDNLQGEKWYNGWLAYARSKLANILFTRELAKRLAGTGVTANVLHPGIVASRIAYNNGPLLRCIMTLTRPFTLSVERGAQTSVYLAASPDVEGVTGKYFENCKIVRSSSVSYDEVLAQLLWDVSEKQTNLATVKAGSW
jgi:NAD(P)-dependent dehydrogenase (short-subunit alcohol dehydrogenase family)